MNSTINTKRRLPLAISTNTSPKTHLSVAVQQYAESGYRHIKLQVEHKAKEDHANPRVIHELASMQRDYQLNK